MRCNAWPDATAGKARAAIRSLVRVSLPRWLWLKSQVMVTEARRQYQDAWAVEG